MAYSKRMFSNMISGLYFVGKNQISYSDDIIYPAIRFYMYAIFYMFHFFLIRTINRIWYAIVLYKTFSILERYVFVGHLM